MLRLAHLGDHVAVLNKPSGMPITGDKTVTVQKLLPSFLPTFPSPQILAHVPRPFTGPVIIALRPSEPLLLPVDPYIFTFMAIIHGHPPASLPTVLKLRILRLAQSTGGPLALVVLLTHNTGHGLRRVLQEAACPALGNVARSKASNGCNAKGLFIACTRLQIPSHEIDVALGPPPPKFQRILDREQQFWDEKQARDVKRHAQVPTENSGNEWFCNRYFIVSGNVMTPRRSTQLVGSIASHLLARATARHLSHSAPRILDLGTGCGAILLSAILDSSVQCDGVGVDVSQDALDVAAQNVSALNLERAVRLVNADFSSLPVAELGSFDVIAANPPYLSEKEVQMYPHLFAGDPNIALVPKSHPECSVEPAMSAYYDIACSLRDAPSLLRSKARLVLEIGGTRRIHRVQQLFESISGLTLDGIHLDEHGFERCLVMCESNL